MKDPNPTAQRASTPGVGSSDLVRPLDLLCSFRRVNGDRVYLQFADKFSLVLDNRGVLDMAYVLLKALAEAEDQRVQSPERAGECQSTSQMDCGAKIPPDLSESSPLPARRYRASEPADQNEYPTPRRNNVVNLFYVTSYEDCWPNDSAHRPPRTD